MAVWRCLRSSRRLTAVGIGIGPALQAARTNPGSSLKVRGQRKATVAPRDITA
jgi:hypothetical protein